MAHLVETMAYANEVPWHGLGVPVSNSLSPDEMMLAAGLDWQVAKAPLYMHTTTPEEESVYILSEIVSKFGDNPAKAQNKIAQYLSETRVVYPSVRAVYRQTDNKILTHASDNWTPMQNKDAFAFFSDFVEMGDMEMETAGALDGGRMVWALAKISDGFSVGKNDQVKGYLLFSNPHKNGKAIDVRLTATRVVCNNTLTMDLRGAKSYSKTSHHQQFDAQAVKQTLGIAKNMLSDLQDTCTFLSTKTFSEETLTEYFSRVFPHTATKKTPKKELSRMAIDAHEILYAQPGAELSEGTWWSAFNTVTYMTDHLMGRTADTRLHSAWYGINQTRKTKALNLALEYASAA